MWSIVIKVQNALASRFPLIYLYKPLVGLGCLILSSIICGVIYILQYYYNRSGTSAVSAISLAAICGMFGLTWIGSIIFIDKPTHVIMYRRHPYLSIILLGFLMITFAPFAFFSLSFDIDLSDILGSGLIFLCVMGTFFLAPLSVGNDKHIAFGYAFFIFALIAFAILRWWEVSWYIIFCLSFLIMIYVVVSCVMSFFVWGQRGIWHSVLTTAGLCVVGISTVMAAVSSLIILVPQIRGDQFPGISYAVLGSSKFTLALSHLGPLSVIFDTLVAIMIVDFFRVILVAYSILPHEE